MAACSFPITDGRTLILSPLPELNADQRLLVKQFKLELLRNFTMDYRGPLDYPRARARPVVTLRAAATPRINKYSG